MTTPRAETPSEDWAEQHTEANPAVSEIAEQTPPGGPLPAEVDEADRVEQEAVVFLADDEE